MTVLWRLIWLDLREALSQRDLREHGAVAAQLRRPVVVLTLHDDRITQPIVTPYTTPISKPTTRMNIASL